MNASQSSKPARPAFKAQTADDLRELIGQGELIVGNLRGSGAKSMTLLYLLDTIHDLVARLQETGIDLRAEAVRIETLEGLLKSKDVVLVREMRLLGGLAQAREAVKPAPAQWWWYLDARVAERRQKQLRRGLSIAAGVAAVLLIVWGLYRYVFPPDPRRMAAMDKATEAEQLLSEGDLAGATALYRQAAEITPEDAELHVWVGVLEEQQGRLDAAAEAFARAEQLVAERGRYLVMRGMVWLRCGGVDRAEADGEAALAANPDSAEAYILLGSVYELRGQNAQALDAFEKASELAEKAGNASLVVMARTRMGMLMQSIPMGPTQ